MHPDKIPVTNLQKLKYIEDYSDRKWFKLNKQSSKLSLEVTDVFGTDFVREECSKSVAVQNSLKKCIKSLAERGKDLHHTNFSSELCIAVAFPCPEDISSFTWSSITLGANMRIISNHYLNACALISTIAELFIDFIHLINQKSSNVQEYWQRYE